MNHPVTVLVVEDEGAISNLLGAILDAQTYRVLFASTGAEALSMAASHTPDIILLDLGLPDMDGMDVLIQLRKWFESPILVVSARQKEQEKVAALDAGANDYITKPFGNRELLARIRTAMRQYERTCSSRYQKEQEFSAGDLRINFARREVRVGDRQVHLTPIEYRIVVLLARNAGMVLTHEHILKEIWGPFSSDSQLLRVNMANIRRKIEPNPADPRYILTEVGVGYRMIDSEPAGGN